jgi:hypothetical protein
MAPQITCRIKLNIGCGQLKYSVRDQLDIIAIVDHYSQRKVVFVNKVMQYLYLTLFNRAAEFYFDRQDSERTVQY